MRRIGHAVYAQHRAGDGVHHFRDGHDVVDGAEDVAGVRAGNEARVRGEEGLQCFRGELRVYFVGGAPPFDGQVAGGGDLHPGRDVGFVVEEGEDQFRAWREGECGREVAHQLRGGRTEDW